MKHNEDSRVKIPTILHLMRLGYTYLSLKGQNWDQSTNIFTDIFSQNVQKLNPELDQGDISRVYDEVSLSLENEDLGKVFYEKLTNRSGVRLVDFEDFDNNSFHVVTELPCKKDDEEFRPDITLLINGMPLAFIEVKIPNNKEGIQAEHKRIERRFQNKKFRKFINATQIMVFSNNMEYDDDSSLALEGAFYATTSYEKPPFNYFREEDTFDLSHLLNTVSDTDEIEVLKDTNYLSIRNAPEFATNKALDTPTNRMCTSLFQRERLKFLLQYAIVYLKEINGLQKHIMRYPQLFATKAIEQKLNQGIHKGIIWHTQGSGKTALAYYNVKYLTDYFQQRGIVPKFYFIVDRLDLLVQAGKEFRSRGLVVHNVNSREEFAKDIKSTSVLHNDSGKAEITVVNIQKFEDDPNVVQTTDYQLNVQRVYFLDEVHRSYNPEGSFLANLNESDPNAIKIGLTGTPLLGTDYNSRSLFGNYIHKYYYNASIKDGYTLRLIREEIETSYKMKLQKTLEEIKVLRGNAERKVVYAHKRFVEPMLDYIVQDFENSRIAYGDDSIGAMVVCDSSEQAKMMHEIFQAKYVRQPDPTEATQLAAAPPLEYERKESGKSKVNSAALILHDVGTKQEREDLVSDFKEGKIDFLFVYNMLLTGFDAKRLKKLYLGRVIRAHNLLQALTRVNRTYKEFRYGYVVDFADIQKEFDKTNRDYFNELQDELGDELQHYSNLFKSEEEIQEEIEEIKEVLFHFDTSNAELFSRQVTEIKSRAEMLRITKVLNNAKSLYNLIRLSGQYEMLQQLDFNKLKTLSRMANDHLAMINTKEALEKNVDTANLLNTALEDVLFLFTKIGSEEMILADALKDKLRKTREMLAGNFDQADPEFITLKEALRQLFDKKNLNEVTKEEMQENMKELDEVYDQARELERRNQLLKAKYDNDAKYARVHKRLMEKDPLTEKESKLFEVLHELKEEIDAQILQNSHMLENENFVEKMIIRLVIDRLKNKHHMNLDAATYKRVNGMIVKEYMNEFYGKVA